MPQTEGNDEDYVLPHEGVEREAYDQALSQLNDPRSEQFDVLNAEQREALALEVARIVRVKEAMLSQPVNDPIMQRERMEVLTRALLSMDSYFDRSIDALLPPGWSRVEMRNRSASSYTGVLYADASGRAIVANRGSVSNEDWRQDFMQPAGRTASQFDDAIEYARDVAGRSYRTLSFTGHSLGGGLAQAQAIALGPRYTAMVFNSSALHESTVGMATRAQLDAAVRNQVTAYAVRYDPLQTAQDWTNEFLHGASAADYIARAAAMMDGNPTTGYRPEPTLRAVLRAVGTAADKPLRFAPSDILNMPVGRAAALIDSFPSSPPHFTLSGSGAPWSEGRHSMAQVFEGFGRAWRLR